MPLWSSLRAHSGAPGILSQSFLGRATFMLSPRVVASTASLHYPGAMRHRHLLAAQGNPKHGHHTLRIAQQRVTAGAILLAAGLVMVFFAVGSWSELAYKEQMVPEFLSAGRVGGRGRLTCPRQARVKRLPSLPGPELLLDNDQCYWCILGDHGRCGGLMEFESAKLPCACERQQHDP